MVDEAAYLDEERFLAHVSAGLFASEQTVGRAVRLVIEAGLEHLLVYAAGEVCDMLAADDALLKQAVVHALCARLLGDRLDEADRAALSLPWSLFYAELPADVT